MTSTIKQETKYFKGFLNRFLKNKNKSSNYFIKITYKILLTYLLIVKC